MRSSSNYFKLAVPAGGCSVTTFVDSTGYMIGGRAASIWLDGLVFCFTWWKTRRIRPSTIVAILNRDSSIYFGALFLTNFVSLVTLWHTWKFIEPVSTWIAVMTATLSSHFILDLRKVAARDDGEEFSEHDDIAMMTFSEDTTDSHPRMQPTPPVVLDDIVELQC